MRKFTPKFRDLLTDAQFDTTIGGQNEQNKFKSFNQKKTYRTAAVVIRKPFSTILPCKTNMSPEKWWQEHFQVGDMFVSGRSTRSIH